jgi:hypothetical protein
MDRLGLCRMDQHGGTSGALLGGTPCPKCWVDRLGQPFNPVFFCDAISWAEAALSHVPLAPNLSTSL